MYAIREISNFLNFIIEYENKTLFFPLTIAYGDVINDTIESILKKKIIIKKYFVIS